jgi:aminomethyltransferase
LLAAIAMLKHTPLHALHRSLNAKLVDFGGWEMPLHYGSQLDEHHQVRRAAGWFDVSHMTVVDLHGDQVRPFLRKLVANNVDKLKVRGKALYTCMLNVRGGVIDDLIIYYLDESSFRLVVNAATRDKDMAWIQQHAAEFQVEVSERRDLAMVAVQGPLARAAVHAQLDPDAALKASTLSRFAAVESADLFVARTGYTGEDGYEVILPANSAQAFCTAIMAAGVKPCGLGARDTLRLEAGMNLYGQDMDESTTPFEAGLAWTVVMGAEGERDFIGRAALAAQLSAGVPRELVGLVMDEKGVLRHGQKVIVDGVGEGEILSGTYSPTAGKSVAMARVPVGSGDTLKVDIRGRLVEVRKFKPPFVRDGQVAAGV